MVHLGNIAQVGVLNNDFQLGAGVPVYAWAISLANNDLFPTIASSIVRIKKFGGKSLAPLDIKLFAFAKLGFEIVGKV